MLHGVAALPGQLWQLEGCSPYAQPPQPSTRVSSPQPNRICRNPCLCGAGYILLCTLFLALPFATKYPKAWLNRKTRLAQ